MDFLYKIVTENSRPRSACIYNGSVVLTLTFAQVNQKILDVYIGNRFEVSQTRRFYFDKSKYWQHVAGIYNPDVTRRFDLSHLPPS